ncbi:hypothetical protein HUJ04_007314 [Dendroctonus ponderosae]|nr:hypothetical protein HUJ04_007314 [Dendroctonus ponderosae]
MSPPPSHKDSGNPSADQNLHMFREALTNSRRGCSTHSETDLCSFIAGEMARHGTKRSSSPNDVPMGSPTLPKRSRYISFQDFVGMRLVLGKCHSNIAEAVRTDANKGLEILQIGSRKNENRCSGSRHRRTSIEYNCSRAFQGYSEHCTTTDTFPGTK